MGNLALIIGIAIGTCLSIIIARSIFSIPTIVKNMNAQTKLLIALCKNNNISDTELNEVRQIINQKTFFERTEDESNEDKFKNLSDEEKSILANKLASLKEEYTNGGLTEEEYFKKRRRLISVY